VVDVVGDVVLDVVGVVDGVEVGDDVALVVGELTSQFWYVPPRNSAVMRPRMAAVPAQSFGSKRYFPNAQPTSSELPAGPR